MIHVESTAVSTAFRKRSSYAPMIANVNEKGRQTKLLAAIAVLAMVVCAFAMVMPSEDVSGMSEPVTSETGVTNLGTTSTTLTNNGLYYVANGTGATDATVTLPSNSNDAVTIYAEQGAVISITASSNTTTVNIFVAESGSFTTTSGQTTGTVDYYADTGISFTSIVNKTVNVTVGQYGFTISGVATTDYTAPTNAVTYITGTDAPATYFNVNAIGQNIGFNAFELEAGGSVTVPINSVIKGNFTVSNDDTSTETTEFTATNTIQFMVGAVDPVEGVAQPDAFTVGTTEVSVSDVSGTLHINTATWTTGTVVMSKGIAIVDANSNMGTATGDLQTVSNGLVSGNVTLYASIEDAVSRNASNIYLYGDYTNVNVTLNDTNVSVQANGTLSGTFSYGNSSVTIDVETESGIPNVIQTSATDMTVNGNATGSGADVSVSDVTVNRVTGKITVSGVEFGSMSVNSVITVADNGVAVIPSGSSVGFNTGGQIALSDGSSLYLYGSLTTGTGVDTQNCIVKTGTTTAANIYGSDLRIASAFCAVLVESSATGNDILFTTVAENAIEVGTYDELVAALKTSRPIIIYQTITIPANAEVEINGKTVTFGPGTTNTSTNWGADDIGILVKEGATLSITDSTFDQADGVDVSITTEQYSQLNITNSLIFMVVDVHDLGDLNVDNHDVTYDYSTDDVKVGFGTTLILSSIPRGDIMVYGTLTINEGTTVTIEYGKTMTVAPDATVNMNGTLNVEGTVTFEEGSTGNLAGIVNVRNTDTGGAQFISYGNVEVSGTMTVSNKSSTAPLQNELIVGSESGTDNVWTGFTVTGSLTVNGAISGILLDKGDITINGQVEDMAVIILFDGVTLNVSSVSGGNLIVTDLGVSNEAVFNADGTPRTNTEQSSGNVVMLDDVRGITVSETVTSGNYTVNGTSYAYYISDMYVSGTASRVGSTTVLTDENITVTGVCGYVDTSATTSRSGAVHIAEGETLTLGEDVVMGNYNASSVLANILVGVDPSEYTPIIGEGYGQKLCVDGTLNVTGDGAKFLSGGKTWNRLNFNDGTIDVNGTVVIGPEAEIADGSKIGTDYILPGDVNGVRYALQTTENNVTSTTIYYTNFDDAAALIADAVDDTITVYGNVSVGTSATIAANCNVILDTDAVLTINDGVTLTVDNGGKITGTQASIEVRGTMTSANYREDVSVGEVGADVIVTEEPARTWTSFANALENASAPQTIELARDITLTANTTIPEGVTVTTEHNLKTSRYTLTVDGTLDILQGGDINIDGTPDEGNVVANGVVVMRSLGDSQANVDTLAQFDGAHFALRTGATVSNYVTNLAYAAENVTSGTITVTGAVSAGDVVFNEASNGTLVISVETAEEQEINTVLSFTTMDLNGATLTVDADSRVTGTVTAPSGDGTADAEIQLSRAAGEFTIESSSLATATGTEYIAYISNVLGAGSMTVAAGTVDVYHDEDIIGFKANGTFQVASGATLVVEDATLTANNDARTGASNVTVSGTIDLDNGVLAGQSIVIDGTLNVIENAESDITIYAAGIIAVGEDATLSVNSKIVVGTAPESLGVGGQLTGSYRFTTTSAYILAYAGADLTGAQIDWNAATAESDALTTTYYINEIEYATVYASATNEVMIDDVFGADGEEIVLTGLDTDEPNTGYAWKDAAGQTSTVLDIGSPEAVYIEFDPANVPGVVTVGAGINLFIDGVQVSGYAENGNIVGSNIQLGVGTHRVSYEISAGWDGSSVVFTFNGQTIENNSTITITADMTEFTLSATGAINSTGTSGNTGTSDDGMGLTDYLLIVLVVLIVIMAIMVALRLMRS